MRLFPPHVAPAGDHVAPEFVDCALSLLNELIVGLVMAVSAGAWCSSPPRNLSATSDSPCMAAAPAPHKFLPVVESCNDKCTCMPLPVRSANGLGMKVH